MKPPTRLHRRILHKGALTGVLLSGLVLQLLGQVIPVKVENKWGLIDTKGRQVTEARFESASLSAGGFCLLVEKGKFGLYDPQGKQALPCEYTFIKPTLYGLWALNRGGECENGNCAGGKWGLYHHNSKTTLEPAYELIKDFDMYGVAMANVGGKCGYGDCQGGKWALLDTTAKVLMQPQYTGIKTNSSGMTVLVQNGEGWGMYSLIQKKLVVPNIYKDLRFINDRYLVGRQDAQASLLRIDGTVLSKSNHSDYDDAGHGYVRFPRDKRWGLADSTGKEILPALYDRVVVRDHGWVELMRDNYYALGRVSGKLVSDPVLTAVTDYGRTYVQVEQGNGTAILDTSGKPVVPFGFTRHQAFYDTLFAYCDRQIMRWVGLDGKVRRGIAFDQVQAFEDNVARVEIAQKKGLVNFEGRWVVPPKYDQLNVLSFVAQARKTGGEWEYFYFDEWGRPSNVKRIVLSKGDNNDQALLEEAERRAQMNASALAASLGWYVEAQKWGLRANTGAVLIRPRYISLDASASPDLSLVSGKIGETEDYGYGIVNHSTGKETTPTIMSVIHVSELASTGCARAVFAGSGRHTIIRKNGTFANIPGLSFIRPFSENMAAACFEGSIVQEKKPFFDSLMQVKITDRVTREVTAEYRYVRGGKWGYINPDGQWLHNPEYEQALPFRNGIARVKLNGKWGLVNTAFTWVVPPTYDFIEPMEVEGGKDFYVVGFDKARYGFIDEQGHVKVRPTFSEAGVYHEGLVRVRVDGLWGFADYSGSIVIPPAYKEAGDFHEGRARVRDGRKWGYIDRQGNPVTAQQYLRAGDFHEGRAWVQDGGMMAFIDSSGARVTEPEYTVAGDFNQGVAPVRMKGSFGLIDRSGKFVLPAKYYKVFGIRDSMAVVQEGGAFGIVKTSGEVVVKPQYRAIGPYSEGLAAFRDGMEYGYIDLAGQVKIPPQFANAGPFSCGRAPVFVGGRWGFIDTTGNMAVPATYQAVGTFAEDRAAVKSGKKWGYIDKGGKVLVPVVYDKVGVFEHDRAAVFIVNQGWGVVNREGTTVVPCQYETVGKFRNGIAPVCKDRKWGVMNQYGTLVSLMKYDQIGEYENGLAKVLIQKQLGILDNSGKIIAQPDFDLIEPANGVIRLEANDEMGYLGLNGEWVWQPSK